MHPTKHSQMPMISGLTLQRDDPLSGPFRNELNPSVSKTSFPAGLSLSRKRPRVLDLDFFSAFRLPESVNSFKPLLKTQTIFSFRSSLKDFHLPLCLLELALIPQMIFYVFFQILTIVFVLFSCSVLVAFVKRLVAWVFSALWIKIISYYCCCYHHQMYSLFDYSLAGSEVRGNHKD